MCYVQGTRNQKSRVRRILLILSSQISRKVEVLTVNSRAVETLACFMSEMFATSLRALSPQLRVFSGSKREQLYIHKLCPFYPAALNVPSFFNVHVPPPRHVEFIVNTLTIHRFPQHCVRPWRRVVRWDKVIRAL